MAKAKKTTAKSTGGKKAGGGKGKASAPAPAGGAGGASGIDTSLAAQAAARMLAARGAAQAASGGPKKESGFFQQLKQSITKPHAGQVNSLLNTTAPPGGGRAPLPTAGGRQAGRTQTTGPDVPRTGVPRRTAG